MRKVACCPQPVCQQESIDLSTRTAGEAKLRLIGGLVVKGFNHQGHEKAHQGKNAIWGKPLLFLPLRLKTLPRGAQRYRGHREDSNY